MTRLPMGFTLSVKILQHTLTAITAEACHGLPVQHEVYVDNVRISGDFHAVNFASIRIRALATKFGFEFNIESGNNTHQKGEFLGIDYGLGRVALSATFIQKLTMFCSIHRIPLCPTAFKIKQRHFESLWGKLLWAARVLDVDMSLYWKILRFRRSVCRLDANSELHIYGPIANDLLLLLRVVLANKPRNASGAKADHPEATLITDASTAGYGANLINGTEVHYYAGVFSALDASKHINEKEMKAVLFALIHWRSLLQRKHVNILVDNNVTRFCLRRGGSRSYHLDRLSVQVLQRLSDSYSVAYIPSRENPADLLSRLYVPISSVQQLLHLSRTEPHIFTPETLTQFLNALFQHAPVESYNYISNNIMLTQQPLVGRECLNLHDGSVSSCNAICQ